MENKFISIIHSNVKKSLNNSLFDIQKTYSAEIPIFVRLKNFLKQRNIYINTYDVPMPNPTYRNIYYDVPYPLPSNFPIWKTIFSERRKNILICTEPPTVNPFNYMKMVHSFFIKVYTWNDDLVDNKKYFKYKLPKVNRGQHTSAKQFKQKKFLALINSNKSPFHPFKLFRPFGRELYSERIKSIEFFEKYIPHTFFLYGRGWNKPKKYNLTERIFGFKKYTTYKGEVTDKVKLLSEFKYCLCFENLTDVKGFVTEKIFDCFKAKCVPIYWGARDIENYIPKTCFIDFREFLDFSKLLKHLNSIDEKTYNQYIKNIEKLLNDKKFVDPWFEEGFSKFFVNDILDIKHK